MKQMVFFICIKKCICLIVSICKDVFFKSHSWIKGENGKLSAQVHTNVYLYCIIKHSNNISIMTIYNAGYIYKISKIKLISKIKPISMLNVHFILEYIQRTSFYSQHKCAYICIQCAFILNV